MNTSQTAPTATGNRITFTSQALPNGTISVGGQPGSGGQTIISTTQLPNTTTIKTITSNAGAGHPGLQQVQITQHHHQQVLQTAASAAGVQQAGPNNNNANAQQHQQQQQQHQQAAAGQAQTPTVGATQTQTLVIKSNHHAVTLPAGLVSSAPGIVTMTKTINQGNQQLLNTMLPPGVVVGMRPPNSQQQQQKNMQSNQLGRVVLSNPHMVGARPQSPSITLSTINPGQTPALLLKTDNGFQLVRVGTATSTGPTVTQTIGTNSTNPTQIRLQTVPAASMANTSSANNIVVNSVVTSNAATHGYSTQHPPHLQSTQQQQQQQQHQLQQHHLPQISQIQTLTPHSQQLTTTNVTTLNSINSNNANNNNITQVTTSTLGGGITATTAMQQQTTAQGNTKEKCRKFLANLIDLSTREPPPVEKNVRNLIQELVNANVEPEEFCDRLERLLNASPQPCLIGFLKKSLPLLRQALYSKELIIEGIKAPPQHVLGLTTLQQQLPKIQAQIRPISQPSQTTTIGQTQVRMISQSGTTAPRPIGHTTITKQPPGLRIQAPPNGPRMMNTQIRGPRPMSSPTLQAPQTHANIVQIRGPSAAQLHRPGVQIRTTKPGGMGIGGGLTPTNKVTAVKVGQTQIKAISSQPPSLAAISNSVPPTPTLSATASILSMSGSSGSGLPVPSLPTVQLPPAALHVRETMHNNALNNLNNAILNNNNNHSSLLNDHKMEPKLIEIKPEKITATLTPITNKITTKSNANAGAKAASKKKKEPLDKDKDDKTISANAASAASAASSFFQANSMSMSSSMYGDDDINDVAAMGGVNLAEESQRILGCTENIGTQIRSCKDEVFLNMPALQGRLRSAMAERGLEEPSQDVAVLISHALQERLKTIVEKLAVIAEHRIDVIKLDPRYEATKDVRGQIKFLEELDKAEHKRHEEMEREMLLRAAKSRSRIEDSEQAKLKARAKEMQRAEMEELRQRDANLTALNAIGPRKKIKLDNDAAGIGVGSSAGSLLSGAASAPTTLRPRIKRVNLRDMLFYMEQERDTCRSEMLYKAYLK